MGDSAPKHTGPIVLTDTHLEPSVSVDRVGDLRVDEVQVARSLVSAWCAADWLLIRWNVRTTLASAGRT